MPEAKPFKGLKSDATDEQLQAVAEENRELEALISNLSERQKELASRKEQYQAQIELRREAILGVLLNRPEDKRKIQGSPAMWPTKPGKPKVVIQDKNEIPLSFWKEETVSKPDMDKIAANLTLGRHVAGCTFNNPKPGLTIRYK